jgi:hypothetical protein
VTLTTPAHDILTVSILPAGGQQFTLHTTWNDPGAWGILLVDLARHAAQAYANDGYDFDKALHQIKSGFDAEWSSPTDSVPSQG